MLDRVSIAAPCSADWESMPGSDRVRYCAQCDKNVYNLSAMSQREAEALLRETEGNLCARLYRRADGTILTENCPVGLRAIGGRVSRWAGAAMALTAAIAAQIPLVQVASAQEQNSEHAIAGVVRDASGAVIGGARVSLRTTGSASHTEIAGPDGRFRIGALTSGQYNLEVESPGFLPLRRQVSIRTEKQIEIDATMSLGAITMGVMVEAAKK